MQGKSVQTSLLLIDSMLVCLLNAGILTAVFPLFLDQLPTFFQTLLISLVSTVVVVLLTRRRWIIPLLAAVLLVAGLILQLSGQLDRLLRSIEAIRTGISSETPPDYRFLLRSFSFMVSVGSASILFLFFRKLFFFAVLPLLGTGLVVWLFFSGSDALYPVLALVLSVLWIAFARFRGRAHAVELSENIDRSLSYHMLTASAILIVVLLLTSAVVPREDGVWQSKLLVRTVGDVSSLLSLDGRRMPLDGVFNLSITGYQPLGGRLGGDVKPNHTIVLHVETEKAVPLAGAYFDTYDGQRWSDAHAQTQYRFGALILRAQRNRVFLEQLPTGGADEDERYQDVATEGTLRIHSTLFGRSLFQTGRVQDVTDVGFDKNRLSFNQQGELFIDGGSRRSMSYTLDTIYVDRTRSRFDQHLVELEQIIKADRDPYFEFMTRNYRQLPADLPAMVRELAETITQADSTPYLKARSIETWLSENTTYTLTPGTPPDDVDFVAHFLQERQGYCVYYASAMTVLARCVGLPARYVTGFALHRSSSDDRATQFVATNASAHAWTEIYFAGIGWISFDPSGRMAEQYYDRSQYPEEPIVTPILSGSPEEPNDSESEPQVPETRGQSVLIVLLTTFILLLGLAVFSAIRAHVLLKDSRLYRKQFNRRYQTPEEKLEALYQRSVTQLNRMGYDREPAETVREYLRRMRQVPELSNLAAAWQPVIRLKYACRTPSEPELETMHALCIQLEKLLLQKKGRLRYWFWRILLAR